MMKEPRLAAKDSAKGLGFLRILGFGVRALELPGVEAPKKA